jgi:glutaredoxin 3
MSHIEIYTKDYCPYCVKAKMLLDQLGVNYVERDIAKDPALMAELKERKPDARTIPQIFINGEAIGGCDDLYALYQSGDLAGKLEKRG